MAVMGRFGGSKSLLIQAMFLGLFLQAGCSRQVEVPTEEGAAQATPFHDDGGMSGSSISDASAAIDSSSSERELPFHDVQSLPAGTLLMVRLKDPISLEKPGTNNLFEASVDTPVMVEGNTLIPQGSVVTGRIESARTSRMKPGRGYMRLALQSVHIEGIDLPVQTASLFVRPSAQNDLSSSVVHLEKGHRLTFRLTKPVYTALQAARATR